MMTRCVARPDLIRALVLGQDLSGAAAMLCCNPKTIRRAARDYGVILRSREVRFRGAEQFQAAVEQHGPGLCKIARALDIDRKWLSRQLERYGIDPGVGTPGRRPSNGEAP